MDGSGRRSKMAEGGAMQKQKEDAEKLRELFLAKHAGDIENGLYDDRDVDKFRKDDKYVCSFIRTFESMQDASDHLHESLKFRLEMGLNDCTDDDFPLEIWESGAAYFHNHDKDGHKILYLQVKQHRKDPQILPTVKKFFAYLVETVYRETSDEQIVVLFDLAGAGLAHLDMDFIKFIINCFKLYYPKSLGYMLMYEMPWLFNAAWKVIKTMLHPESVKRIKFVTKSDIQAYIDKDQLWEHMGGTDKFVYKYEKMVNGDATEAEMDASNSARKRVTFEDQPGSMTKSLSADNVREADRSKPTSILTHRRSMPTLSSTRRTSQDDNSFIGRLLTICPAEELEFVMEEGAKEACDTIVLKNTLPYSIAFKVKTTSPEKYRVKPSSGLVKPGSEVEVTIHLQQGYQNTVHKDKFLVMGMEVTNDASNNNLSDLWKSVQKDSIMEHRLRCVVTSPRDSGASLKGSGAGHGGTSISELSQQVDTLVECNRQLSRSVRVLMCLQCVCLVLLLAMVCAGLYNWWQTPDTQRTVCTKPGWTEGS